MCQTKAVTGLEFSRNIVLFIWIFRPPLVLKQASSAEKKICLSCQVGKMFRLFYINTAVEGLYNTFH